MSKPPPLPDRFAFAVTGNPILHSKSPAIFNAVFREFVHLFHSRYCYSRIAADSAAEAVYLFKQLGLSGMNVTAPFKKDIMDCLDMVDSHATRIGGVNTVISKDGGLIGYNTDYIGVVEALVRLNIPMTNRHVLVLGAGGAGRAAAYGLVRAGAEVVIANRTYDHAAAAAKMIGCRAEELEALQYLLTTTDILISTLPGDIDIIPDTWLKKDLVVFDANYKNSPLVDKAMLRGCRVIRGEEWLLNQAIPAFRYFTGIQPGPEAIAIMRKILFARPWEKPKKIALVGFMACGKTKVGKILAKKMGYTFKDVDSLVEKHEDQKVSEIFKTKGEPYFRKIETSLLKKELNSVPMSRKGVVYSCGGGAVLAEENKTQLICNAMVVWLYSAPEVTLGRLQASTRPLLDVPNPGQEIERLLQLRLPHYGRTAHLIVNSEKEATEVAGKIYEEITKTFHN